MAADGSGDGVGGVTVVDHPLAGHLLAGLRDVTCEPERFRFLARRLATVLVLEAVRDLPVAVGTVTTPLAEAGARRIAEPVVAVPILRAGLGLLDAATEILPEVRVGYVGLERDHATLQPTSYYCKLPTIGASRTLLLDPMLATGGSAAFAAQLLADAGATDTTLVCVVAAPEGIARLQREQPRMRVVTAAVDDGLDERGYIVPGLGDFGDRLFGTS